jgi:hypothetical protein
MYQNFFRCLKWNKNILIIVSSDMLPLRQSHKKGADDTVVNPSSVTAKNILSETLSLLKTRRTINNYRISINESLKN